jgi:hypothetical protein
MIRQLAHVDVRGGRTFVTPSSKTVTGMWKLDAHVAEVALEPAALAAAIGAALSRSRARTDTPDDDHAGMDALLAAAGVKSWPQFMKGRSSVTVLREGDTVKVWPMEARGSRGMRYVTERELRLTRPSLEELAAAVLDALPADVRAEAEHPSSRPATAAGFGPTGCWLAVRANDRAAVAAALGLVDVREETWEAALRQIESRHDPPRRAFVTPPVDGWTLVALSPQSIGEQRFDLAELSRRFGEAQYFATQRAVEYHEWQRWVNGDAKRRYCFFGERGEIRGDGEPSVAEADIVESADDPDGEAPDEETVLAVAAEWSVDPTSLEGRDDVEPRGLLGWLP